jgi:hypothetical protein
MLPPVLPRVLPKFRIEPITAGLPIKVTDPPVWLFCAPEEVGSVRKYLLSDLFAVSLFGEAERSGIGSDAEDAAETGCKMNVNSSAVEAIRRESF